MILKCLYIDTPDPGFLSLDARYQAGFLDPDTVWRYAQHPEYHLNEESVRRGFAAKDECFAIREGENLAAYGWYSRAGSHYVHETLRLHFDPQWVYMYHGFTHPSYRGKRLHAFGMTMALAAYRARGSKGFASTVETWNDASLKSCARMGYHEFGTIWEIRLGRLVGIRKPQSRFLRQHLVFHSPGCKRFGFWLEALSPSGASRGLMHLRPPSRKYRAPADGASDRGSTAQVG